MDCTDKYRNRAGAALDEAHGKPVVQIRDCDAASCDGVRLKASQQADSARSEIEGRRSRIRAGGAEQVPGAFVSPGRCACRPNGESRMTRTDLVVRSGINRQRAP